MADRCVRARQFRIFCNLQANFGHAGGVNSPHGVQIVYGIAAADGNFPLPVEFQHIIAHFQNTCTGVFFHDS